MPHPATSIRPLVRPRLALGAAALTTAALAACGDAATTSAPTPDARLDAFLATLATPVSSSAAASAGPDGPAQAAPCTYDEATGWHTCPPVTRNGLTISRSVRYVDASGAPLPRASERVAAIVSRSTVSGTLTLRDQRMTIQHERHDSLAIDAATRTTVQHGTSSGTESGTATGPDGEYTVVRTFTDTTRGVTMQAPPPPATGGEPIRVWPSAGSQVQSARTTFAPTSGGAPRVLVSRHVMEWLGGGRARVTITFDGKTSTCTIDYSAGNPARCVP